MRDVRDSLHFAAALLLLAALVGCPSTGPDPLAKKRDLGPPRMTSLDVQIALEPNADCPDAFDARTGCLDLVDGKLPDPGVAADKDYCPTGLGTATDPLLYQSGRRMRVYVNVIAIGSGPCEDGTSNCRRPFPVNGPVALSGNVGTIFSGTPVTLENGKACHKKVVFMNAPGKVQIWAESATVMRKDGELIPATFSIGASDPLYVAQPTLPDVQRTNNDAVSPLDGQRVDLQSEFLVVTRLAGNGFVVQDLAAPTRNDASPWNGLFVFAYNGVDTLVPGTRLLKLRGAITEFQGMTQLAEPEFVAVGAECAPKAPPARFGVEDLETDEGGLARRARCPQKAQCATSTVTGTEACLPRGEEPWEYDRLGRVVCHTAGSTSECPSGMACLDRADWNTVDSSGHGAFSCQVIPRVVSGSDIWTTSCFPIFKGEENLAFKLRNEALEGVLLELQDVRVAGLDMGDDFMRSGFESFGQWKVLFDQGAVCATVVSEVAPDFGVLDAQARSQRLSSVTGTLRQVRFKTGSAFWMVDVRHKDDIVLQQ